MDMLHKSFNDLLSDKLETLSCDRDTRAYIVNMLDKFKKSNFDYSNESIILIYTEAKFKQDFITFDNVGSWIFLCDVFFPEHLNKASIDIYHNIGRLSYYSCYRILNRQWKLYEQMADLFPHLTAQTRKIIQTL